MRKQPVTFTASVHHGNTPPSQLAIDVEIAKRNSPPAAEPNATAT